MLLAQPPQVQFLAFPKNFRRKIIDIAEVNQRLWLEESGQWPENLVPASGKPVSQKAYLEQSPKANFSFNSLYAKIKAFLLVRDGQVT